MPPLTYFSFKHVYSETVITIGLYTTDFKKFEKRLKSLVKNPKNYDLYEKL